MVTIHDIAKAAGVSIATVSRAFKADAVISPDTKNEIMKIAKEMNYSPKKYHKGGSNISRNSMVGVIISCRNYPWFNLILQGIISCLDAEGITPLFADTNENPYKDVISIDKMKDIVSGLIVVTSTEMDDYCTDFLMEINQKVPVVTMVRNTNIRTIDSIEIDSFHATYKAINSLIAQGHKHIAIINGPMTFKLSFERLAAYTEALRANDIPIRNEYICYGNFEEENARDLTIELIKNHPKVTAIFSTNTAISRGCLLAFDHCNMTIPDDIAFLSYGDEFSFGLNSLNISVVSDPNFEIGQKAAELLLKRMTQAQQKSPKRKPARIIFTPNIILRGSEQFPKNHTKP